MSPTRRQPIDGPEAFAAEFAVSRETVEKLEAYAALLRRWQKTINLVAPSTLDAIWERHFADSAQLYELGRAISLAPLPGRSTDPPPPSGKGSGVGGSQGEGAPASRPAGLPHMGGGDVVDPAIHWLDVGSGAGFPGLVIAILAAEAGASRHTLIESDSRKAAFLREVSRTVGVPVDILCGRIESAETRDKVTRVDRVTARALAPLPRLLELVYPYFASHTVGLFAKGREVVSELKEARAHFAFECALRASLTDDSGQSVILSSLKRLDV